MSLLMSLQILDHPISEFDEGVEIVKENTPGGKVFVLAEGSVKISINGTVINETSSPGELFGEIASIKGCNYGATVTTTSDSKFYVIDNFISYLKQNPEDSIKVLKTLCDRILTMNKSIAQA